MAAAPSATLARHPSRPRMSQARGRLPLLAAGLALEAALLGGLLRPLAIWSHPAVLRRPDALAAVLGSGLGGALAFAVPVVCAFAAFGMAVWAATGLDGRARDLVLGGTALFSLTLLPINPVVAHDVYHNIADARTFWVYGENPAVRPPVAHADDPFFPNVPAWVTTPSAYGPVWYALSGVPLPLTGGRLWPNVFGQKALTALFLLWSTALAMAIASRGGVRAAPAAGVLVGWNPLLQFETAGNAHNDIVMVCFALAALYTASRRWWPAVFPLLALAVAVKSTLAVLGPPLLVWMLRDDVPRRQVVRSLALGLLAGVAVYLPFIAGGNAFATLRHETIHVTSSPGAVVHTLLWQWWGLDGMQAFTIVQCLLVPCFLGGYALLLWRLARDPSFAALLHAAFWAVFLLLTLIAWWFQPWYVVWLVPLGALAPGARPVLVAAVFSAAAMFMYLPHHWLMQLDPLAYQAASAATAFLAPVLAALAARPSVRARLRQVRVPATTSVLEQALGSD